MYIIIIFFTYPSNVYLFLLFPERKPLTEIIVQIYGYLIENLGNRRKIVYGVPELGVHNNDKWFTL